MCESAPIENRIERNSAHEAFLKKVALRRRKERRARQLRKVRTRLDFVRFHRPLFDLQTTISIPAEPYIHRRQSHLIIAQAFLSYASLASLESCLVVASSCTEPSTDSQLDLKYLNESVLGLEVAQAVAQISGHSTQTPRETPA